MVKLAGLARGRIRRFANFEDGGKGDKGGYRESDEQPRIGSPNVHVAHEKIQIFLFHGTIVDPEVNTLKDDLPPPNPLLQFS